MFLKSYVNKKYTRVLCIKQTIHELQKENTTIFINVRTDTFLLNVFNVLEATQKRIFIIIPRHRVIDKKWKSYRLQRQN